jgi:AcrR family transcriptional regulator
VASRAITGAASQLMTADERFSMAELVRRTGVRPGTIRHYTHLGLLPPPHRVASNRFLYDRHHEQAVRTVRLLRERRQLGLAEIGDILAKVPPASGDQAFRTDMWDTVVDAHLALGHSASSRLLRAGVAAFTVHGFAEVTIDEVCREAELAKGSFYRYFPSKEHLFFAAAREVGAQAAQAFHEATAPRPRSRSRHGLDEDGATAALARALAPNLPLLLDLLALASRRRPGHVEVAKTVFGDLRSTVVERLAHEAPGADGRRVVDRALVAGIRALLG